jgi:hypothetical protein
MEMKHATRLSRLTTESIPTTIWDGVDFQDISVTSEIFAYVIHYMLMDAQTAAQMPRMIHLAAMHDEWDSIAIFYAQNVLPVFKIVGEQAAPIFIFCREPWAAYDPQKVMLNSAGSYFGKTQITQAQSFAQFCQSMPEAEPAAMYDAPKIINVPVLVLIADEDPQNPPENMAGVSDRYPNSLVLIEPYRAHSRTACADNVMTSFIELGSVEGVDTSCLASGTPIPFDVRP